MTVHNLYIYFQERFPLPGVMFISISFALLALAQTESEVMVGRIFVLILLFTALLLRQRVTDEFKDMHHDSKNYPSRPYQRGVISKMSLITLLSVALVLELSMAYLFSGAQNFWWYMPVFVYSLLMAKEFFVSSWLEDHFTTYFLVHEVLFLLLAIWVAKVTDFPMNAETFSWAVAFISIMMCIEVVRKFEVRFDTKGEVVNDTYTSVWGENVARSSIEMLVIISGIALSYAQHSILFALISAIVSLSLNLSRPRTSKLQMIVGTYVVSIAVIGVLL